MTKVKILERAGSFAEDKDKAAKIREEEIRPAVKSGVKVVLDFTGVNGATQSFVHALIADVIRQQGSESLERIDFRGCNPTIKSIVGIVADYSQLDIPGAKDLAR